MRRDTESISQGVAAKLIRELRARGYGATPVNTSGKENSWDINKIWVTSNGGDLCDINCENNTIAYKNAVDRSEVEKVLNLIDNLQEQEENFLYAPNLKVENLEKYKLLAEYNNVILAACEVTSLDTTMHKVESLEYVTWEKDKIGPAQGVHTGHYFGENYVNAKEDFTTRSSLVSKDKLFSETERIALYAGLVKLESMDDNTFEDTKIYENIKSKISNIIPNIEEKIYEQKLLFQESVKNVDKDSEIDKTHESEEDQEDYEQEI